MCIQQSAPKGWVLMCMFRHPRDHSEYVVSNSNYSWSKEVDPNWDVQPESLEEWRTPCTRGDEKTWLILCQKKTAEEAIVAAYIRKEKGFFVLNLLLSKWYQIVMCKITTSDICIYVCIYIWICRYLDIHFSPVRTTWRFWNCLVTSVLFWFVFLRPQESNEFLGLIPHSQQSVGSELMLLKQQLLACFL